jgi:hypothetical protein
MSLSGEELDVLYRKYGFQQHTTRRDLRAYVLRQGYLHGADIVPLTSDASCVELEREFKSAGYATHIRRYESIDAARLELFNGFFSAEATSVRLDAYYKDFVSRRTISLGSQYTYIPCPYSINGSTTVNDGQLVSTIVDTIHKSGPQLVLVEAAAGFGKTCTAYELLPHFSRSGSKRVPIFTELSRNRQARVFRYVLLDEIDKHYAGLKSALVEEEIKAGLLPLIIDGFDELLGKKAILPEHATTPDRDFESIESMLDTIGALLEGESKIVLTTRRTAMFSGAAFANWADARLNDFSMLRLRIHEPDLASWLGPERASYVEKHASHVQHIKNPVLLTFLRNTKDTDFEDFCSNADELIRRYFTSLLDREQQRQDLRLSADGQLTVLKNLARQMTDADIVSDDRDSVSFLISMDNEALLEATRLTYAQAERPTIDDLAEKLTNHALLDRAGHESASVGFVNDFIFGTLIGDNLIESPAEDWVSSERMFNLAATAYRSRSEERRFLLWKKLLYCSQLLDTTTQLLVDMDLAGKQMRALNNATFDRLTITGGAFSEDFDISNVVFNQCTFRATAFNATNMSSVGFLGCSFFTCKMDGDLRGTASVWFRGCKEFGSAFISSFTDVNEDAVANVDYDLEMERKILEQFWPPGRPHAQRAKQARTLVLGFPVDTSRVVYDAIERLKRKGLVYAEDDVMLIDTTQMADIRRILGRS